MGFGTNADPAVTDPAAPASFMSLAKGIVLLLATAGASAVSAVLGATTDAAVITDAAGTINARLRGLVNIAAAYIPTLAREAGGNLAEVAARTFQPDLTATVETVTPSTSSQRINASALVAGQKYGVRATVPLAVAVGAHASVSATWGTSLVLEVGEWYVWIAETGVSDGVAVDAAAPGGLAQLVRGQ